MRHIKFILCKNDLQKISELASRIGFIVIADKLNEEKTPLYIKDYSLLNYSNFYFLHKKWIFDSFKFNEIENNKNIRYDLQPRVNYIALEFSHYCNLNDSENTLRWGELVYHDNWLKMPECDIHSAPSDVLEAFMELGRLIKKDSFVLKTPRGRWHVLKYADKLRLEESSPLPMAGMN